MKKSLLLLINILIINIVNAQTGSVGIGTSTPDSNAILELQSSNRGFLLPRVALIHTDSAQPLSAHIQGMTVYNTANVGNVVEGNYFNNGSKWIKITDTDDALWVNGTDALGTQWMYAKQALDSNKYVAISKNGKMRISNSTNFTDSPNSNLNVLNYLGENYTGNLYGFIDAARFRILDTLDINAAANQGIITGSSSYNFFKGKGTRNHSHGSGNYVYNLPSGNANIDYSYGVYSQINTTLSSLYTSVANPVFTANSLRGAALWNIINSNISGGVININTALGMTSCVRPTASNGGIININLLSDQYSNGNNLIATGAGSAINIIDADILTSQISADANTGGSINITNYRGLRIINNISSATVQNKYGIVVDNISGGVVDNYSIYSNQGRVSLGDVLQLRNKRTPSSSTDVLSTDKEGDIIRDDNFIYILSLDGTVLKWKRSAISTW